MLVSLSNRDISNGMVLAQEFLKRGLPVSLSYAIGMTIRKLRGITEQMAEERQRIVEAFTAKDSEGKRILSDTGDGSLTDTLGFAEAIEGLMKEENDVDVHVITLKTLEALKDQDSKPIRPSSEEMEGLLLLQMLDSGDEKDETEE